MSITARLDRIMPGLSARQRAVLVLRALASYQEPDPGLREIADEQERRAFNRYMGFIYVVDIELEDMLHSILWSTECLERLTTVELLREAAGLVEEQTGEKADARVVKTWRKARTVNVTELFLGVADEVRVELLERAFELWRDFLSLEAVAEKASQEFDGESLLLPEVRDKAEEVHSRLKGLIQRLEGPRRLPGPSEATVQLIRDRIDRAFDYPRLVEIPR